MAAAGVQLAFDMTEHAVLGLSDVIKNLFKFRRLLHQLYHLAVEREPDAVVCVDFSGFNSRLAHLIRKYVRSRRDWFHDWDPKIIQYVSPQVWASREWRAYQVAEDYDLVLSLFPFEKEWYAKRVPKLRVEFVGHPLLDRYDIRKSATAGTFEPRPTPRLLLLPGSRTAELRHHLPVMLGAVELVRREIPGLQIRMVLPNEKLVALAETFRRPSDLEIQTGRLAEALQTADVAVASTGTVTMECAFLGVPTVAIYKTSWSNYQIAKRVAKVKYVAMPNIMGNEEVFPEFIQDAATAENIAGAALELLRDESRRRRTRARVAEIVATLGESGASRRAAKAIAGLLEPERVASSTILAKG
jgi:lipid-A-disaccharide synthase